MSKRILLIGLAVMFLCSPAFAQEQIKIGSINDLTGATSDVGKDAALGIRECVTFINDQGGINGKKIKLCFTTTGTESQAITIYKRFRDTDKIALLLQWAQGYEALSPRSTGQNGDHFGFPVRPFVRSCKDPVQFCLQH
jgi:branched-chain amino acid transport system substrate-binding protein